MALIPTPRLTSSPGFASVTARFPLGRPVWACGFFPVRASPPTSPPTPPFYCWVYCFKSGAQICLLFPRIKKCPTCRLLSLCLASQRRQSPAQIHRHKFYFKGFKAVFTRNKLTLVSHRQDKPMWEAVHQSRLVEVHQLHTLEVHDDDHLYMDNDM